MNPRRLRSLVLAAAALVGLAMVRPPARPIPAARTTAPTPAQAIVFPTPPPALVVAEDARPFKDAPDAIGIAVEGGEDESDDSNNTLTATTGFTIQFPDAMVAPDRIDADGSPSPITIWPDLNAKWVWRTQSQGAWTVNGPVIPGQTYRMRLRDDLKNLAGKPLQVQDWGYELETRHLTVTSDYDVRDSLSSEPQVPLEFNFPVRLHDAAAGCWFQDRATRQRFPAEILLNRAVSDVAGDVVDVAAAAAEAAPTEFRVRPRDPLPVGHYYDLIVEGVHDAYAGRTLPYPEVFALGTTRPFGVGYVVARNWPTDKPHIEVKFDGALSDEPLPADALKIEPAVPHLALRKEGEILIADGDFDPSKRYRVNISADILGDRGYPLAKAETWGATFHPKEATLMFPEGTIRQRAALGLRFALLQANTGPITWRLARIPLERLAEAQLALKNDAKVLIDALHLDVVGKGELPSSGDDREVVGAIDWKPSAGTPPLSGPYLMEAATKTGEGGTVSNAALIFFNEAVFTQKTMPSGTALRLARMSDAQPISGVAVKLVTATLAEIARGITDDHGVVAFPAASLAGAAFFMADLPGALSVEPAAPGPSFPGTGSSYASAPPVYLGEIITDRPLYRPDEEVKFKGFLRRNADSRLAIPEGAQVAWKIVNSERGDRVAEGAANVNAFGGWDAAWKVPPQGRLGEFKISAKVGETDAGEPAAFRVEEFRNPAFSVVCETHKPARAAESTIDVASEYFHGAPNVGSAVKWTATWLSDSDGEYYNDEDSDHFKRVDLYSEQRRTPAFEAELSGETALDAKGRATIPCAAPFKDPGLRARCDVSWRVDVTGPDGQTITGGVNEKVVMNDVSLGVRADSSTGATNIAFDLQAIARDSGEPANAEVQASLFLVQTKSVKERLAPFVYRYRNTDAYVPIEQKRVPGNGRLAFAPTTPGRYVLVVAPLPGQPGIPVSDEIYLAGKGEAELPVKSDQALDIQSVEKDKPVPVGGKAAFDVLSPSPGIAWVTVETDRILDTYTIPIPGNSTRIEIPVKPGYAPNVRVSAYLLRPGHADDLPGEMFGSTELKVTQPGAELAIAVAADHLEYQPRTAGALTVRVTADGRPVPDAEVTLYAVDDSILTLGGWELPALLGAFLPAHPFNVVTRLALSGYIESFSEQALTQKGFVVGGGGKDDYGNTQFVRKNFRPLILWLPSLKTGAGGVATAKFTTPDNLTRFRVIALGQTTANQFGAGDTTFTVSKPVLVEPALPHFLRQGDEVELRAVARQKISPEEKLTIRCVVGDGVTLSGPESVEITAGKDQPAVAAFRARIADDATAATVHFAVTSASGADEVELTIPVASRTIQVRESVAGAWSGQAFDPAKFAPAAWLATPGDCDITLSTSPYLVKLLGIPQVLDYPYGCFEQKSSRLLVYTALAKLLAFLPQPAERDANYRRVIEDTLKEFDKSLLPDDTLPYWPYGTVGNPFVTIQSAWAVAQAQQAGYDVPEGLAAALPRALNQMVLRKSRLEVDPTLRAFALFALSQLSGDTPDDDTTAAANELFLGRDRLTDEGRAMLAVALHAWNLEPGHQQELIGEIPEHFDPREFNPNTFSSTTRAEAICTWARLLITPDAPAKALQAKLEAQMNNSTNLSTQENLWLLVAFNALLQQKPPARLSANVAPPPDAVSTNHSAAAWLARDLAHLRDLSIRGAGRGGACVLAARRSLGPAEQAPVARGLCIERIVKNLTDPARTGTADAPFRLGDQVLISFRFRCDQAQSFVAIEDALPAGLEIVNPNLEMIGKFYSIPDEPGSPAAWLSFSEMRDKQTNLFFDSLPAGSQSYAILARATAAGTFAWPSAQMTPMYDARFYARTAPATCVVKE
ncbi:MAG: alpha-2-macroglobulin family protein [Terrimicrobiaceae bacterium]|nr:alpha-2-macroglobulin family protein [Terrimicrobiaceae bacterium]